MDVACWIVFVLCFGAHVPFQWQHMPLCHGFLLNDNTVYTVYLFICGGPCHLSSIKLFWDIVSLWEQLVYSLEEKVCIIATLIL